MAHTRADAKARQNALDGLFQSITELEGVVAEAEDREQRMTGADSATRQANIERFPALGGRTS